MSRTSGSSTFILLAAFLLVLPQVVGSFLSEVLGTVGLYVLMGLGLNIVVGYAGLLDLGYVAFFAIGAYSIAILTSPGLVPRLGARVLVLAPDRHGHRRADGPVHRGAGPPAQR